MMELALLLLVILTSSIWFALGVYWFWIAGRVPGLARDKTPPSGTSVTVIVTAMDEEDTIAPALQSLIALDYRPLDIIVVNDRSHDATGAIIDRLVAQVDHAQAIHIDTLPQGWLGKVHAMHKAAEASRGDWLLFTDADVVFHPGVVRDALAQAEAEKLDHFSLLPSLLGGPCLLDITVTAFAQVVMHVAFGFKPVPFGAGAFNMVRRSALLASPGIQWLKMEVADDTGLAFLIADNGGSTKVVTALHGLSLSWYPSLSAMFRGLEKNSSLLISQGKLWRFALVWSICGAMSLTPWLGLFLYPAWWPLLLLGQLSFIGATLRLRHRLDARRWLALFAPVGFFLIGCVSFWSMVQTTRKGGIHWRGTFYPIKALVEGQRVKI
jgi:hypothetical protein